MNLLIVRLNRFFRVAVVSVSLTALLLTVCLAEGWGDVGGPPKFAAVSVTSFLVTYADGSTLTRDGTYTCGGVQYSVPPAEYNINDGELDYSEGTILYADGTWVSGPQ
jgi:hypothetical protein